MFIRTRGIVFNSVKFSETSVISRIYTEKLGLVSYMVKGVRSAKSKARASLLQPLTLLNLEVSHRENRQLQYLREFSMSYPYESIPFNPLKSAIALFLLEVLSRSVHEHEPNEEMFEFIYNALLALDEPGSFNPDFHLFFLTRFAGYSGFAPMNNFSKENCFFDLVEGRFAPAVTGSNLLDRNDSRLLNMLLSAKSLFQLKITRSERKQVMANLLKYYQLHIANFNLKSPEILEAIMD